VWVDFSTLRTPEEHAMLRDSHITCLNHIVKEQGLEEVFIGTELDGVDENVAMVAEPGQKDEERLIWQSLQIWLLPTAGLAVEMSTRSDARRVAKALVGHLRE
jgi:hypothetical protein